LPEIEIERGCQRQIGGDRCDAGEQRNPANNGTMMQYFYWDTPANGAQFTGTVKRLAD
jgi:hypothetical protein